MILLKKILPGHPLAYTDLHHSQFLTDRLKSIRHDYYDSLSVPSKLLLRYFFFLFDQINMTACNHYFPVELQS